MNDYRFVIQQWVINYWHDFYGSGSLKLTDIRKATEGKKEFEKTFPNSKFRIIKRVTTTRDVVIVED